MVETDSQEGGQLDSSGAQGEPVGGSPRRKTGWRRAIHALLSVLPGILVYAALFRDTLNPLKASWLYGPADVTFDVATAGMGWMYFSHGGWHWPLTTNPDYGGNIANSLMFSDSVPAFSLPLKLLLGGFLDGRPSQILGLSLLFCLVMQSTLAYALISRWTAAAGVAFFGTFLFVGAPVLLLRWNIMSLFWQWLVLAALLLISASVSLPRRVGLWGLLVVLSTGITAYVSVMYLVLGGADLLVRGFVERGWRVALGGYAALLALVPLGLYLWGAFEIPLGSGSAGGLGEYSADVLALVDSQGLSRFFQDLPGGGAGENYAFLGFGVIGLLVAGLAVEIHRCSGLADAWTRFMTSAVGRPEVIAIAAASLVLAMVSILPDPAVAGHKAGLDLPEGFLRLLSTFRANGRFMWPLMYATILLSVVLGSRVVRFAGASLVAFAVLLQYVDQAPVFRYVTTHVQQSVSASPAHAEALDEILGAPGVSAIEVVPAYPYPRDVPWREIGYSAFGAGLPLSSVGYFNRYDSAEVTALRVSGTQQVLDRDLSPSTVYFVSSDLFDQALSGWKGANVLYVIEGWYVVRAAH